MLSELLRLALPCTLVWLIFFYVYFHLTYVTFCLLMEGQSQV